MYHSAKRLNPNGYLVGEYIPCDASLRSTCANLIYSIGRRINGEDAIAFKCAERSARKTKKQMTYQRVRAQRAHTLRLLGFDCTFGAFNKVGPPENNQ